MHPFWTRPSGGNPAQLNIALQQLHHAAQLVAAVGQSLLPPAHDDSHTNMEWLPAREILAGDTIDDRIRIGLQLQSFAICLADREGTCVEQYPLDGKTPAQSLGWLRQQLNMQGFAGDLLQPIEHYTLPPHPLNRGGTFQKPDPEKLRDICTCYHNAYGVLTGLAKRYTPASSGVRVWPHHFDMAVLIEADHEGEDKVTASIGAGLAIGGTICPEPYYYVRFWRKSGPLSLTDPPQLLAGRWLRDDFQGAILPLGDIPTTAAAEQQQRVVEAMLEEAIHYGLELLR